MRSPVRFRQGAQLKLKLLKMEKTCISCGKALPYREFYVHKQKKDGRMSKCKDCYKKAVRNYYSVKSQDPIFMQNERTRCRIKAYKYPKRHKNAGTSRTLLKKMGFDLTGRDVHHWDYSKNLDVFVLSRRAHLLIHGSMTYRDGIFEYNGELLGTKEAHYGAMKSIFEKNFVNYEIESITI